MSEIIGDTNEIGRHIFAKASPDIEATLCDGARHWSAFCESPIEVMFLTTCTFVFAMSAWVGKDMRFTIAKTEAELGPWLTMVPQFPWREYRIDFAIFYRGKGPSLFIECDGHQFHERTPEQAERDRRRDRECQQAGIPIIRFTGREIYRSPTDCVLQMLNFIGAQMDRL